ncbi:hypothetical protein CHUAL_002185 [Chamberlinius hualienensis]
MDKLQLVIDNYNWTWTVIDHRVDGWLLTSSAIPMITWIVIYLAAVAFGPEFMKNRKPIPLQWILVLYNSLIAVLNLHIFKELIIVSYQLDYKYICEAVRVSSDPEEMRIVSAIHLYFISKLLEFLDTIFIILRKKNKQLTFLHVYHHSTMFFFCWIGVRWVPGGCAIIGALINSFVHVIMYTYYGLSSFGKNVAKFLWWKRYITVIQLVQFFFGLFIGLSGIIVECPFPKWMHYTSFFYMISYIILFGRFYQKAYTKKSKNQLNSSNENSHNLLNGSSNPSKTKLKTNGAHH